MQVKQAEQLEEREGYRQKTTKQTTRIINPNGYTQRKSCLEKRRYPSHEKAIDAQHNISNGIQQAGVVPKKMRTYLCPMCHGYHLTSISVVKADSPIIFERHVAEETLGNSVESV